ncbi:MAG: phosphate uptake regulator PhoU [Thaumarchaeota archaeon]|nr:MAG: phosphate uptake regulator PhoU [Nitrososphaerota archaeon]
MDARKVLEMGGSFLISIPKDWAKRNGVSKGDTVVVEELSERRLVIRPIEQSEGAPKEVEVDYPREDLTYVINDVTAAYLLGYDIIRVQGRMVMTREDRERLKSTIGRLIGLEIIDEDSKKMTLQFLLEPTGLTPERIAKRMMGIIEGMIKDTGDGVATRDPKVLALVAERDDELDRLYFLLVRAVRTAAMNQDVAQRFALTPVEILDYRVLASFLESVGDTIAELSKKLAEELPSKDVAGDLVGSLKKLETMESLSMQSFLARKVSRTRGAYLQMASLSNEVSELSTRIARRPEAKGGNTVELVGLLERASSLFVDISDLSAPNYPPVQ